MSLLLVKPVGSSGGESIASKGTSLPTTTEMVSFIAVLGGLYLRSLLRFPASQLTGPLGIAAIFYVSGIITIALPKIFLILSKIVIEASLGSRITGLTGKILVKAMVLSLLILRHVNHRYNYITLPASPQQKPI